MVTQRLVGSVVVSVFLSSAGTAGAAAIPVNNPGFETQVQADGVHSFSVPGWATFGGVGFGGGTYNPTSGAYAGEAPEGENVGWLVSANSAGLAQTLASTFQAGHSYTLTVLVGDRDDRTGALYELALGSAAVNFAATGALTIPTEGAFSPATLTFDAGPAHDGLAIAIRLYAWTGGDPDPDQPMDVTGSWVDFDDVRLEEAPTAPPGAGRVTQLLVGKTAQGDVQLEWQPSCSAADDDYAVFGGNLGAFASHGFEICSTGGTTAAVIAQPAGSRYYLVVPLNGTDEGSYGVDGSGVERPAGAPACWPQNVLSICP